VKGRIHTDSFTHQFRLLRNRIEAEVATPSVLLVTSATERDGAGVTAYGLAESLSKTHQRTALVTITAPATSSAQLLSPGPPEQRRRASDRLDASEGALEKPKSGLSVVSISHERLATISRASVASLVQELRNVHDYVVIDGGDLPNNSFALLLVASVDAVLVTFLAGRQQVAQDREMLDTFERAEAKVLGVVMTDQESIDHFAQRDVSSENHKIPVARKTSHPLVHRLEVALQRMGKPF
jgi:Mrp family chromosome partitioning ATPase